MPLRQRAAILPEDVDALAGLRPDVLVTREAPLTHRFGFAALDALARSLGVRLVVHGHHHSRQDGFTVDGIRVIGLAKAEVLRVSPGELP